jgi:hypothetical protein
MDGSSTLKNITIINYQYHHFNRYFKHILLSLFYYLYLNIYITYTVDIEENPLHFVSYHYYY